MSNKNIKKIALIGIMGSGKTTIGKVLAKKLNLNFIDLDKEIVKDQNKSINKIFADEGEEYFRQIECEIANKILTKNESLVLSLGGGAFVNKEIRNLVQKNSFSIWLNVTLEKILERVSKNNKRPLLNNVDKEKTLYKLIKEREPYYSECNLKLDCSDKKIEEIIKIIQEKWKKLP